MARRYEFNSWVTPGDVKLERFTWRTVSRDPVNLTGFTVAYIVKVAESSSDTDALVTLTSSIGDLAQGQLWFQMTGTQTAKLTDAYSRRGRYFRKLVVTDTSSNKNTLVTGLLVVRSA